MNQFDATTPATPRRRPCARRRLVILTALTGSLGLGVLLGGAIVPTHTAVHTSGIPARADSQPSTQGGPWVP